MMILMSFSETIFLFLLALVIFGPKKLPEIARQVGKYLNEFKRASNEFKAQIEQEIAHIDVETQKQTILPPRPAIEGTASRTPYSESSYSESQPVSSAEPTKTLEAPVVDNPALPAASGDNTMLASNNGSEPPVATEPAHAAEEMTSNTSQESHA